MRVGVVGVGAMGQNHARVLAEEAELVAVVDPLPEVGAAVAKRFRTRYLRRVEELLALDPDAVTVAASTEHHFAVTSTVLKAGVPVLVEKPFCGRSDQAEALVDLAKAQGLVLAVGMVERHNPTVEYVGGALGRGEFGDVITAASRRVSNFPARVKDIGVIMDLGIHDVDVMRHLLPGEVQGVYALAGRRRHATFEDHANILLEFRGGIIGTVEVNWLTPVKVRRLSLTCDGCFVEVDYTAQVVQISEGHVGEVDQANLYRVPFEHHVRSVQVRREEPLVREMRDLLRAIEGGGKPLVTGEDALTTLRVVEAAVESQRRGRRVELAPGGLPEA